MEKDRGFRVIAIIAILVSIVGLTVGFASLNQTLNINGTATIKGSNWSVKFINMGTPALTGAATATANLDDTSAIATITADLKKPGDKAVIAFDVTNAGDIDAKLNATPVFSGDTATATAAKINYSLKYSDGTELQKEDTLNVNETRHLVLTLEYDQSVTEVPSEDTAFDLTIALLYTQN